MDVVEFIKTRARMCENLSCGHCPLKFFCSSSFFDQVEIAEDAASVVEQWAKEHPIKTRQSEFLKQWPDARLYEGVLEVCPAKLSSLFRDETGRCSKTVSFCPDCRRVFWLKEIE